MAILRCGCKEFKGVKVAAQQQDAMYGEGMRVHNETAKEDTYRCTVCGTERSHAMKKSEKKSGKK